MGSLKMQSLFRCKKRAGGCGHAKYPVSFCTEQGRRCKFGEIRGYLSPWYRVCTKAMIISKESYRHGEPKNVIAFTVQKTYRRLQACKRSGFMQLRIGPTLEILGNSGLPISMYRICTRAMVIPKRSYGYGEPKYVIALSVQKTYWRLWTFKLPGLMQSQVGPTM